MHSWPEMQAAFATGIRDSREIVPAGLAGKPSRIQRSFAVHRNNHRVNLVDALLDSFPVTAMLVGKDFFGAMALEFIAAHPPTTPVLNEYGHELPGFISGFPPADSVPYLADVARLESAWLLAYHAQDLPALTISHLQRIPPEQLARGRVRLHPSVSLIRSPYPVASIWSAHRGNGDTGKFVWTAEQALIARPDADVNVILIKPGDDLFLVALGAGNTIAQAASEALSQPGFDAGEALVGLVSCGAVAALDF